MINFLFMSIIKTLKIAEKKGLFSPFFNLINQIVILFVPLNNV